MLVQLVLVYSRMHDVRIEFTSMNTPRMWDIRSQVFGFLKRRAKICGLLALTLFAGLGFDGAAGQIQTAGQPDRNNKPELVAQIGHTQDVNGAVFSPDGKHVLTAGNDHLAILWEIETGREIRRFKGHNSALRSAMFSPDSSFVLTSSFDETARLWSTATGAEIRKLSLHDDKIISAAFSPDGCTIVTATAHGPIVIWETDTGREVRKLATHAPGEHTAVFSSDGHSILTASNDNSARLWDADTGRELRQFKGHSDHVTSAAISPDGRYVATSSYDNTARLWDASTGQEIRRFTGHVFLLWSVAFSSDGRYLVTASFDTTARVWDASTGKQLRKFKTVLGNVTSATFSANGKYVLTSSFDQTARIWSVDTGAEVKRFTGNSSVVNRAVFAPDGRSIVTLSLDGKARILSTSTGRQIRQFLCSNGAVSSAIYSPDSRFVLSAQADGTARMIEPGTGKEVRTFKGHVGAVNSAVFSADGRMVLTAGQDGTARLWKSSSGQEFRAFKESRGPFRSAVFSSDDRLVLTAGRDKTVRLWDITTGRELRQFHRDGYGLTNAAFSPDRRLIVTYGVDFIRIGDNRFKDTPSSTTIQIWDAGTGRLLRELQGHGSFIMSAVFSRDGRRVLTSSLDRTARLWETDTGKELEKYTGHSDEVLGATFSSDERLVLTASWDHTARLWETQTGRELCCMTGYWDGTWAVTDSAGRYDAANAGEIEGLHWVVGNETIALKQLKARYYDPGLLSKYLGQNREPLRDVLTFDEIKLYPSVAIRPATEPRKFNIGLTSRGGGIGKVQVFINSKEVQADARGSAHDANAATLMVPFDLSPFQALLQPDRQNVVEVIAYNAEGYLASRGTRLVTPPDNAPSAKPELYAIIAGIDEYADPSLSLKLPAHDAIRVAAALRLGANRLFGVDKVHLTLLESGVDDKAARAPTKANFEMAFKSATRARPGDILVVYLAGHGLAIQDTYCYLTSDARGFDLSDPAVRDRCAVTSEELARWINQIPALKQAMVLDTCAAGAFARRFAESRDVPGDQVRAIDRLKDRTGFYVLMGCAADAVSYEASQYGQGLLTYALLQGMQGAKLRDGEFIDISPLFEYAADVVPRIAGDIGGIQRPQIIAPVLHGAGGGLQRASFDIGRLNPEDRSQIVLPQPRPLVLRPVLINVDKSRDDLGLNGLLSRHLRDLTAVSARGPSVVFVEADDLQGAVTPSGTYTVKGGLVRVRIVLTRNGKEMARRDIEGAASNLDGFAQKMAIAIAEAVR